MTQIVSKNSSTRKVFILRIWQLKGQRTEWVAELQNAHTGEIMHAYGREALLELLQQMMPSNQNLSQEKKDE